MTIDREYQNYQQYQRMTRPGWDYYAFRLIGIVLKLSFRLVWTVIVTLVWFIAYQILASNGGVAPYLLLIPLLAFAAWTYWDRRVAYILPVCGDILRLRDRLRASAAQRKAIAFLLKTGVISQQTAQENPPRALFETDHGVIRLKLLEVIEGTAPSAFVDKAKQFQSVLNAKRTAARILDNGGVELTFYLIDPLDEPQTLSAPAALDPEKMRVACAVNSFGDELNITFGDSSGMVIGGVPGSGKTAGVTSFLLPLALSPFVNLHIIDGKGGDDWTSYEPAATTFIRGDEDLEPILQFLEAHYQKMNDRIAGQKNLLGTSNFWNADAQTRLQHGEQLELLVIDECQGVFELDGRTKEEKVTLSRIRKICSALVKKGRSAGYMTLFITQKPTSESLPTAIRDNCGLRVAFRLTTDASETAVLGDIPKDDIEAPRATRIPSERKGGAILANDAGGREEVRFYYLDEQTQETIIRSTL